MDRIQWMLDKAITDDGIMDPADRGKWDAKNLLYDGTKVIAGKGTFSWNVSQASPRSEYLL